MNKKMTDGELLTIINTNMDKGSYYFGAYTDYYGLENKKDSGTIKKNVKNK